MRKKYSNMEFQVTFFVWKEWKEHMLSSKTDVGLMLLLACM